MFKIRKLISYLAFLLIYIPCISQNISEDDDIREQTEKSQIKKTFDLFLKALSSKKIDSIEKYYSENTIQYLDDLFYKVKKSDSLELEKLSYLEKAQVLTFRHLFSKEDILTKSRKELLKNSYIDIYDNKNTPLKSSGYISVDYKYEKGKVQLNYNGYESDQWLKFIKKNGKWKIDLTDYLNEKSFYITWSNLQNKEKENNFIIKTLYRLNGKTPKKSIWQSLE